mmetsp:Transcript_14458/g.28563  ORF Transcript_14458/g.28563 Transcript_14458/m.28563 type:complete len:393 (-) Transcript_14458:26-1204(-)
MPRLLANLKDAIDELLGGFLELLVLSRALEDLESLDSSSHRKRVARKSPSLVHVASGSNHLHDLLFASVRSHGKPPPNDLAHGSDVRSHSKVLLRPPVRDPEASHDLIEDKQGTVLVAKCPQPLKELLRRHNEASVADHRLQHDGRNLILVLSKQLLDRLEIVVLGCQSGLSSSLGHTRRVRETQSKHPRTGGDEEAVSVSVVATLKLDDLVTLRVSSHKAQHAHARLGSRVGETHHLHAGNSVDDHLCENVLIQRRRSKRRTLLERLHKSLVDLGDAVAADGRAPGSDVVDVLVAINVEHIRALDRVKHHRLAADRLEGTDRRRYTAGHDGPGLLHDLLGLLGVEGLEGGHAGALVAQAQAGGGHGCGETEAGGLGGEDRHDEGTKEHLQV